MAPRRVLQTPPPLPSATMAITKLGHTTGISGNPFWVLRSPPPLPSATISFSTNGHTTGTTGNNVNSFGSSQPMDVGTAATTIPASAALRLSKKFYRTAGLAYPFFRMIKKAHSLCLFLFCQPGSNPRNIL